MHSDFSLNTKTHFLYYFSLYDIIPGLSCFFGVVSKYIMVVNTWYHVTADYAI